MFYDRYGVEEYYLYDPENCDLSGWLRNGEGPEPIDSINQWISPRLEIRFDCSGEELQLCRPDGEPFLTYVQVAD